MIIKSLSLRDYGTPATNYATLVENGLKAIETRTWTTKHRGDLLICCSASSKSPNAGLAVCVVELYHIELMQPHHETFACCKIYDRANSWFMRNHRKLSRKFKVKGSLIPFDVVIPDDVELIPTGLFDDKVGTMDQWIKNRKQLKLPI